MDDKPSPIVNLFGWALTFAAFAVYKNYEDSHPVVPPPARVLPQPEPNSFAVLRTRWGEPKVVPTIVYFEDGRVIEGEPDSTKCCIRWRYRRQP
jgi:hypothetical protein